MRFDLTCDRLLIASMRFVLGYVRFMLEPLRGVFTKLCLTYYFLFEKIYICLLGYLLLYSKGGGGTEPLVYPCNTKRKYPSFAGVYHLGDAFIRSSNLMHNCP